VQAVGGGEKKTCERSYSSRGSGSTEWESVGNLNFKQRGMMDRAELPMETLVHSPALKTGFLVPRSHIWMIGGQGADVGAADDRGTSLRAHADTSDIRTNIYGR